MDHHPVGPHAGGGADALEDVLHRLLALLLLHRGEGDVIGGVQGEGDAVLHRLFAKGSRRLGADAHPVAALVLVAVKAHLLHIAGGLDGGLVPLVFKALGIARRAEFCRHFSPPPA